MICLGDKKYTFERGFELRTLFLSVNARFIAQDHSALWKLVNTFPLAVI